MRGIIERIKNLPQKTKVIITASAAAVLLIALILVLVFAVIVPAAAPKTDVVKYLTVTFDGETQYNGNLTGSITLDRTAFMKDFEKEDTDEVVLSGAVDRLLSFANLEYSVKEGSGSGTGTNFVRFDGLGKDDVLNVKLSWPDDPEAKNAIAREEKTVGMIIDKSEKTYELKLADYVEKQKLELKKPAEVNALDYIKENNLIVSVPVDGKITAGVNSFKTKIGDYTLENGSFYESSVRVYDSKGSYLTSIFFEFSKTGDLKEGDTVELSYAADNRSAEQKGILLTGEPVEYTVVQPEALSADSAKNNLDAVKSYFESNASSIDPDVAKGDKTEISSVYFSVNKKDETFNKLVVVYSNNTKKYFRTVELSRDAFFSGSRLVFYGYTELNGKSKTAEDAVKAVICLDTENENYTVTKVG